MGYFVDLSIVRRDCFGICGECYRDHETSGRFRTATSINRSLRRHLYKFFQSIMGAHKLNDLMAHDIYRRIDGVISGDDLCALVATNKVEKIFAVSHDENSMINILHIIP